MNLKALTMIAAFFSASAATAAAPPKLVVLVAIDQFRADYLTRFEDQLAPGGFRRLMNRGAYFPEAHTVHFPNVTAVGHAAMLTGALPYLHGIVSNYWFDQALHDKHYCVQDPASPVIGGASDPQAGRSPRGLLVTTVGDELKNAYGGKPRVVTVAIKDRAAILMGGHRADLALWFDERAGGWTTSAYYLHDPKPELPAWVSAWNAGLAAYMQKSVPESWTPLLPEPSYARSTVMPDDSVGEAHGLGKRFPHPIQGNVPAMLSSPFGNAYTLDTALAAVRALHLGKGAAPDLLAVSLSSFDILGHTYGPLSREAQDATLRLDRALARFFEALGREVPGGLANVILAVTADHGVQVNPLFAKKAELPGGLVLMPELAEHLNAQLRARYGFGDQDKPVTLIFEDNVHLDHALFEKKGKSVAEASRALARWIREQSFAAAAYAKADLLEGAAPPTTIAKRMSASTNTERSGDILIALRPGVLSLDDFHDFGGTGHESPIVQDAAIPLLFFGTPFKPGRYHSEATMLDLAATLSAVLGIIPPSGCEGHALAEALLPSKKL